MAALTRFALASRVKGAVFVLAERFLKLYQAYKAEVRTEVDHVLFRQQTTQGVLIARTLSDGLPTQDRRFQKVIVKR